ncbi:MAG: hypothetical protein ACLGHN_02430 [Bacteriovoracia bacterium]
MALTLTLQGWFYLITGLWPLIHMKSFEKVSGEKIDKWLVRTVSLMIVSSGVIFVTYNTSKEAVTLAIMNATALMMIDLIYVTKKVISKVYLIDAVIEVGFIVAYFSQW